MIDAYLRAVRARHDGDDGAGLHPVHDGHGDAERGIRGGGTSIAPVGPLTRAAFAVPP